MPLPEILKMDPHEYGVELCQAPEGMAIPTKRACMETAQSQFRPSGHGKIVGYENTTQCSNRNGIVARQARLPGQSEGWGAPLAKHSEAQRKRAGRVADNVPVQILRGDHQGLSDNQPVRAQPVDSEILVALESHNLFSVHDVRQLLDAARSDRDWVKDEEISEDAKRFIRRCARRGWIRPRATYPGQWEITASFYLRP